MDDCQCVQSGLEIYSTGDFSGSNSSKCEMYPCASLRLSQSTRCSSRDVRDSSEDKMRQLITSIFYYKPVFTVKPAKTSSVQFPCCFIKDDDLKIKSQTGKTAKCRYVHQGFIPHFVKNLILNKSIIFLLVILLNVLVAGSTPTHRARHRHLRQSHRAYHLCDKVMLEQPTVEHERHRVRRNIGSTDAMSLWEGQDSTLCPYTVCIDEDLNRKPVHIHRAICQHTGCSCQDGSFQCTQLWNEMDVWYGSETNQTKRSIEVQYGCVCAAKHGKNISPLQPEDDE